MEYTVFRTPTQQLTGSSLLGVIEATYERLVEMFGEPFKGDGEKTDAEWQILLDNGHPVAIYNYKDGFAYNGASGKLIKDITDWHVGGHYEDDLQVVEELVEGPKSFVFEARLVGRSVEDITKRLKTMIAHIEIDGKRHSDSQNGYHAWSLTRQRVEPEKDEN